MCEAVAAGAPKPARLRKFLCAGAPIPPALIDRVYRELDLKVCSLWGMTESLSSTLTEPERALEKSSKTDGRPLDGVAVKVLRMDGSPAAGRRDRRCSRCAARRCASATTSAPTWSRSTPRAGSTPATSPIMDDEGYIRINGRIKDIIIRGGENVPIVEIENLLFKHPAVLSAALVGYPDSRLGERACAFVVLRPGQTLDLAAVQAYMAEHKVAKQYWPERVEIVADLPKTPAGKVQKFQLREQAKAFGDVAADGERVSARFSDRVCVVTGAARGIGLAIAERLRARGRAPRLSSTSARRRLEPAVAELRGKGFEARGYRRRRLDRRDDVHAMFRAHRKRFRRAGRRARQQCGLGAFHTARGDRRGDVAPHVRRSASKG